jgi:hypothetical protein
MADPWTDSTRHAFVFRASEGDEGAEIVDWTGELDDINYLVKFSTGSDGSGGHYS